jgi:hypothetical protein
VKRYALVRGLAAQQNDETLEGTENAGWWVIAKIWEKAAQPFVGRVVLALSCVVGFGCESDPTVPAIEHVTESVALDPGVLSPGQHFAVVKTLHNPTGETVRIPTFDCIARIEVRREGVAQNWDGATGACRGFAPPRELRLFAHSYSVHGFSVRAGRTEGSQFVPALPGEYDLSVTGVLVGVDLALTFSLVEQSMAGGAF